jgi:hypothetical protein
MEEEIRTRPCVPARTNPYASSMDAPILTESIASRKHPEPAELQRFLRGEVSRDEARAILRHLLTGCPECVAVTRPLWGLAKRGIEPLPLHRKKGSSRLGRLEAGR